jgi:recombination protein RecT
MTGQQIATQTPTAMVQGYTGEFAQVLPSHIKPETWTRLAVGALRRDEKLRQAAANDPGALMSALLDAARMGLEPGTEQYYLTVRSGKVLGVSGYQGEIELMYRAGAVSSVIVEPVFANDGFQYRPGRDDRPLHDIDWDADDRGPIRLAYAYAVMKDGAISKVVVVNKARIKRAKDASATAGKSFSPWTSDEVAMWMKTAVHDLRKWVPTSAEYIREQLRAVRDVSLEEPRPAPLPQPAEPIDLGDAEVIYDDEGDPGFPADGAS